MQATLTQALTERRPKERSITYIEGAQNERIIAIDTIYQRALGLLYHLQQLGAAPGDEVLLLLTSNEQFVDAFWACQFGGMIPVPVAPGLSDEHRFKLFRILGKLAKPFLCTDRKNSEKLTMFADANELRANFSPLRNRSLVIDRIEEFPQDGKIHAARPDDIALVQFSSGSTSAPKGVALTHRNLLTNIAAIIERIALCERDTTLSWMPLTHDMGLIGFHLTPLFACAHHCLLATEVFVRRPQLWLTKSSDKKANVLCSPNFGYKHFLKAFDPGKTGLDLSHVRIVFNGAEPISVSLCEEFLTALAPQGLKRSAMYPVYGLAEASLAVSFPAPGADYETVTVARNALKVGDPVRCLDAKDPAGLSFACVGSPVRNCQVRIGDGDGAVLGDDVIGHIQIAGDNVTRGYYNDEVANRAAFDGEWLDTGDLGFTIAGELIVTGRAKEILFVNGQNYFPHDLEALLESAADIELGKAVVWGAREPDAATDDVLVFVLFRDDLERFIPIARNVTKAIAERTGLVVAHVIPVRRIPKTTSGKIQRFVLGESYSNGEFDEAMAKLRSMRATRGGEGNTELRASLQEICAAYISGNKIGVHDNIFEIGTSSLTLAQIYEQIEKRWPGKLEITDFFDFPTIAELANYLDSKLAPRASRA